MGTRRRGLLSMWADRVACGATLAGLDDRNYASPAGESTPAMKKALPAELRGLLD